MVTLRERDYSELLEFPTVKYFHGFVAEASGIDLWSRYANVIIPNCWNFR
ncbi:hypothetical protein [Moorena bouillonii]|nr:hypothetical protein [Moorena bouillonii]NEO47484.1 hypothetical protein [Moorena sp. SIO4A3]